MKSGDVNYARIAAFLGEPYRICEIHKGQEAHIYSEDDINWNVSDADLVLAVLEKLNKDGFFVSLEASTKGCEWSVFARIPFFTGQGGFYSQGPTPISAISALVEALGE